MTRLYKLAFFMALGGALAIGLYSSVRSSLGAPGSESGSQSDEDQSGKADGSSAGRRKVPFILVLPAYRQCDAIIEAWNGGLGQDFDMVVCMPAPQDLNDPSRIERIFGRVKVGTFAWVTASFEAVRKGEAKIPKSAKWFFYDHEPWQHTPAAEKQDVVGTSKAIREFCSKHELKVGITPVYAKFQDNFNLELIKKVAVYYDVYLVQCQDFQKTPERRQRMAKFLSELAKAVHEVNPECRIACQLGSADRYGDGTPGSGVAAAMQLYELTKDVVSIYSAWWEPEEERLIELLKALDKAAE